MDEIRVVDGVPRARPRKTVATCHHCGCPQRLHLAPCSRFTDQARLVPEVDAEIEVKRASAKSAK